MAIMTSDDFEEAENTVMLPVRSNLKAALEKRSARTYRSNFADSFVRR